MLSAAKLIVFALLVQVASGERGRLARTFKLGFAQDVLLSPISACDAVLVIDENVICTTGKKRALGFYPEYLQTNRQGTIALVGDFDHGLVLKLPELQTLCSFKASYSALDGHTLTLFGGRPTGRTARSLRFRLVRWPKNRTILCSNPSGSKVIWGLLYDADRKQSVFALDRTTGFLKKIAATESNYTLRRRDSTFLDLNGHEAWIWLQNEIGAGGAGSELYFWSGKYIQLRSPARGLVASWECWALSALGGKAMFQFQTAGAGGRVGPACRQTVLSSEAVPGKGIPLAPNIYRVWPTKEGAWYETTDDVIAFGRLSQIERPKERVLDPRK